MKKTDDTNQDQLEEIQDDLEEEFYEDETKRIMPVHSAGLKSIHSEEKLADRKHKSVKKSEN